MTVVDWLLDSDQSICRQVVLAKPVSNGKVSREVFFPMNQPGLVAGMRL